MRRIWFVPVGWPNCGLVMTRSIAENVTRLRMFVAVRRHSSVSRRGKRNTRAKFISNEDVEGPRIELRLASPQVPGAGAANAAGFAYESFSIGVMAVSYTHLTLPTILRV